MSVKLNQHKQALKKTMVFVQANRSLEYILLLRVLFSCVCVLKTSVPSEHFFISIYKGSKSLVLFWFTRIIPTSRGDVRAKYLLFTSELYKTFVCGLQSLIVYE